MNHSEAGADDPNKIIGVEGRGYFASGYSLTEACALGRYFQEAKVLQIGEGTSQLQWVLIAEYALGYRQQR